jgi:GMP reductase
MEKVSTKKMYDFNDVLIIPKSSILNSRKEVNLTRTINFNLGNDISLNWSGVPIIASNMTTTGTFEVYCVLRKHKLVTALHKFYTLDDYKDAYTKYTLDADLFMVSTGISDNDFARLKEILSFIQCKWICIDVANGYISNVVDFCKKVRATYPTKIIVAGNVTTAEGVERLCDAGVNVLKVGIGPGSACTTRLQTGIGMPQISAVMECAKVAHKRGAYILSDGGITCPGDVSKALGAGGDFVMIGGEFAGHDENPGEIIEENGEKYKLFYGMSSSYAMELNYGKMEKYRSSEGRKITIKYKGCLDNTILNYLGGIRSTCTYINAKNIDEMEAKTQFIEVNQQCNRHLVK